LIHSFQAHTNYVTRIKQSPFSNNSNYVATCSADASVKIWDSSSPSSWTLIRAYSQHSGYVYGLEWLDEDTLISIGLYEYEIKIWSLSTGQTKRQITTNKLEVNSLKLLNNKIHLAVGHGGYPGPYNVLIYNVNDGSLISTLQGHTSNVKDLVQISNSNLLISSSNDRTIKAWDLTSNECKFTLNGHSSTISALKEITPGILASASEDSTIKLWDITNGTLIRTLTGHTGWILFSLDLMNNGGQKSLVSGGWGDKTIKVWDWLTGECMQTIQTQGSYIFSLAVIANPNMNQQPQTTTISTTASN
jgi:WD40 repeat protein